jgi:predicted NUDIX family NTP pyrophosphohydrolase
MSKTSAGVLLYRKSGGKLEIFLVHPGGPFWRNKDNGAWSVPKGEIGPDEDALAAAKREFEEETGFTLDGDFVQLQAVKQSSGKAVYAWAVEGDCDALQLTSNTFEMKWPPKSGRVQTFPEIDKSEWFSISVAREKIIKGQLPLLDELEQRLL